MPAKKNVPRPKKAAAATATAPAASPVPVPIASAMGGVPTPQHNSSADASAAAGAGDSKSSNIAVAEDAIDTKSDAKSNSNSNAAATGTTATATTAAAAITFDDNDDDNTSATDAKSSGVDPATQFVIATYSESQDRTAPKLLSRDEFRENTFARDNYKCVFCGKKAVDAHHIIERKLFSNGGYFLENSASVCSACHMKVEQTMISCSRVRTACGIKRVVMPHTFLASVRYDKWGNPVIAPPAAAEIEAQRKADPVTDHEAVSWPRQCGPLFLLDNVMKVMKSAPVNVLQLFSD